MNVEVILQRLKDGKISIEDVETYLGRRTGHIFKLETNIDDCSGEVLGITMERLLNAGAGDVHYIPVFMKKNRPAYLLTVICKECQIPEMENIIFEETTTIGIRRIKMESTVLDHEKITMTIPMGEISAKICRLPSETKIYPEYECISEICRSYNLSYLETYKIAIEEIEKQIRRDTESKNII